MYTGYTPSATPKPATKPQLLALRDLLLSHSDKNAAAAVDNVIDILSQVVLGKSPNDEDGTYPSPYISGGEVYEPSTSNNNDIPF